MLKGEPRHLDLQPLVRAARPQEQCEKKSNSAAEQSRPDVAADRAVWKVFAADIDPRRLVFLDETFGTTTLTRLYGWGP